MTIELTQSGLCKIEHFKAPAVGFGTYPYRGEVCERAVKDALDSGYRIFDTATLYQNFPPVGRALNTLNREEYYLISKVWPSDQTHSGILSDIKLTLHELEMDYLDAYLLHWPNSRIPIEETLGTLHELQKEGLVRHIGMSNVTVHHLKRALELQIPLQWIQTEMHPYFCDFKLLEMCRKEGITPQAWAPLSRGKLGSDPFLEEMGKAHQKSSAQIALRWIFQHGCLSFPGSQNPKHIQENLEIFDFALTSEEMSTIDNHARVGQREVYSIHEFDHTYEECWPRT